MPTKPKPTRRTGASIPKPVRPAYDPRASRLDRQADMALAFGRHQQAERLAHHASDLRGGAAR